MRLNLFFYTYNTVDNLLLNLFYPWCVVRRAREISPHALRLTEKFTGDNSGGATPLPFPNREVKPTSADGTAIKRGRVSRCQFLINPA